MHRGILNHLLCTCGGRPTPLDGQSAQAGRSQPHPRLSVIPRPCGKLTGVPCQGGSDWKGGSHWPPFAAFTAGRPGLLHRPPMGLLLQDGGGQVLAAARSTSARLDYPGVNLDHSHSEGMDWPGDMATSGKGASRRRCSSGSANRRAAVPPWGGQSMYWPCWKPFCPTLSIRNCSGDHLLWRGSQGREQGCVAKGRAGYCLNGMVAGCAALC